MNLNEIEAKCFIMALFIRDDGLRFLLGSGAYEFKDSQLMFAGNTIENDVVAVQGNDGYMLAGQVRRPSTQVFDGYIGDASVPKSEVEGYRRDFMAFFQKNHFYTVVYVMADGSAIQRRRGFLVDAPTSQELWQMYPEYHVALNFEDVNYYKYSENDDGEETYAKSADIGLAKVQYGGLIWDNNSEIEISGSGTNITLAGTIAGGAIESVELKGDTTQQTYSGKNLLKNLTNLQTDNGVTATLQSDGQLKVAGTVGSEWNGSTISAYTNNSLTAGTYTFSIDHTISVPITVSCRNSSNQTVAHFAISAGATSATVALDQDIARTSLWLNVSTGTAVNFTVKAQLESGSQATSFEPYVGGTASPNPDYPQEVQTVTGRQVVTISDGGSQSQDYEINLGKNLLPYPYVETTKTKSGITFTVNSDGSVTVSGTSTSAAWFKLSESMTLQSECFMSGCPSGGSTTKYSLQTSYSGVVSSDYGDGVQLHAGTTDPVWIVIRSGQDLSTPVTFYPQIEKGTSKSSYAPYFTPIELCKLGTYQDYIYKSGEDWYIKKNVDKIVLNGTETYSTIDSNPTSTDYYYINTTAFDSLPNTAGYAYQMSDRFQDYGSWLIYTTAVNEDVFSFLGSSGAARLRFMLKKSRLSAATTAAVQTWFSSNQTSIYYALATPTDTQITNADLIAQLEDLLSATTYSGTTYITVSGDLSSPLEITVTSIGGGGVEWDANGAVWEAGGGGEIVIVNVDSIENILPVWTIRGEAENPTLTNLTTGMSITYNGTVASGQTLVIDLLNKTAKLNGTSVISDVSGQWVEFKPGNNRVSYSTENANAPDSTIEWQEVVG